MVVRADTKRHSESGQDLT